MIDLLIKTAIVSVTCYCMLPKMVTVSLMNRRLHCAQTKCAQSRAVHFEQRRQGLATKFIQ